MPCLLSLTPCHPDDVLGMHATPDASGASEPPGRLPPVPGSHGKISGCLAFPRENLGSQRSQLNLTVLSFREPRCSSTIRVRPGPRHLSESSFATYCGMHATPVYCGKTVPPGRLPSCTGSPVDINGIRNGQAV